MNSLPPRATAVRSAFRRGVGIRLLAAIVLFSSAVTLASTILQLSNNYRRDVDAIERRFDEIEHSNLSSLAGSLWNVDTNQIRLQLEGLLRLPDMQALELREAPGGVDHPLTVAVGERGKSASIWREYPLIHQDRDGARRIGTLYAEVSLTGVYGRLIDTAAFILVSQGIKTFLVSLFTLYLVHRLITRHLATIAEFASGYDVRERRTQLLLERTPPRVADELDQVTAALNGMTDNLGQAYAQSAELSAHLARAKQLAEERAEHLARVNQKLVHLARITAHDLQEPIRPIVSFTQLIRREIQAQHTGELDDKIAFVERGGRRLKSLFEAFQHYTSLLIDTPRREACDLTRLIHRVLNAKRKDLAEAAAEITVDALPTVEADSRLLEWAAGELVDNAITYRSPERHLSLHIRGGSRDSEWWLSIEDNGPGLPNHGRERLFEPFIRFSHLSDSAGIGLAICREVAELHGGRIEVQSSATGTTFTVTIPQ